MKVLSALFSLLPLSVIGSQFLNEQQPLADSRRSELIYELQKAEIIPTVINWFAPLLTVEASWENASAKLGNTINPSELQDAPKIQLVNEVPAVKLLSRNWNKKLPQLSLALTDPDAPSRDNPEWSQICHWLVTNVILATSESVYSIQSFDEIVSYKPPGPPPKTGKHRYVFVALSPKNSTTDKLHLSKPGDRQHWGYDEERLGLREWAEENGLMVVGANFIYSQNDKQ